MRVSHHERQQGGDCAIVFSENIYLGIIPSLSGFISRSPSLRVFLGFIPRSFCTKKIIFDNYRCGAVYSTHFFSPWGSDSAVLERIIFNVAKDNLRSSFRGVVRVFENAAWRRVAVRAI